MTYATLDDLTDAFGTVEILQLADRDGDNEADAAFVAAVLADADAEIDSYLRMRYPLPLAAIPGRLRGVACDIARYRLYPLQTPETVRQRYEDARAWLRDIAAGRAQLDLPTETPVAALQQVAFFRSNPRRFGPGVL